MKELLETRISENIEIEKKVLNNEELKNDIIEIVNIIVNALRNGNKLLLCGNGGSASDALHFAGEIVGRFVLERKAWPAIVLNADVASMTAISNDYSYDEVFSRQVEAHANQGDVFIGFSTSGNSKNIIEAVKVSNEKMAYTIAFTGKDGGNLKHIANKSFIVPSDITARIQEIHGVIIHVICELVEKELTKGE